MIMWPFNGKGSGVVRRVPTERVVSLSSQGMPETEIIGVLKNEGYTPVEVDSAMKQALKSAAGGPPRPSGTPPMQSQEPPPLPAREPVPFMEQSRKPIDPGPPRPGSLQEPPGPSGELAPPALGESPEPLPGTPPPDLPGLGMPPLPGEAGFTPDDEPQPPGAAPTQDNAPQPTGAIPTPDIPPSPSSPGARQPELPELLPMVDEPEPLEPVQGLAQPVTRREGIEEKRRQIEELIEGIVEERWTDFRVEMGSIMSQFKDISDRISRLEQSAKGRDSGKSSDLDVLEKKMESYNSSVEDISSRMGAMENAIKSSMTPMMQTLRSLSDTIKSLKDDEKGSKKGS
ncbi:MAG: hypothetical protein KAT35_03210 [Candidatus Aenigmarchaeota archaeon]|nr:hypothetical protein [Candidatus Aenigmarchaeota archaeon]